MLEKHSSKAITAIALASLAMLPIGIENTLAYSEDELDKFGIKKIYPTAQGGNEWYVNMENPSSDSLFRNLETLTRQSDGSWQVDGGSNGQVRLEAWSPENERWLNVEITEYAKIESGSNELLQMYSRGGHHTTRDECLGSAYKARLYGDGRAAWNKELTHPAYAGNRAVTRVTTEPLEDRWIGFKAVIYNFVEDEHTYVRLESYIDDDVTDDGGNLVVRNNWKLASVYEDRGEWETDDDDFDSSCGRERDEILTRPGGTATQNIAAWRSDDLTWSFKYLSVREIDPTQSRAPTPEEPVEEQPASEGPMIDNLENITENICCYMVSNHYIENDGITTMNSVDLIANRLTSRTSGTIVVAVVQDDTILGMASLAASELSMMASTVQLPLVAAEVKGDFRVVVMFNGNGMIAGSITGIG